MNNFLISLNIIDTKSNSLMNKNGIPILFYSASNDIKTEISKNISMNNWIKQNIINYDLYNYVKITYIYYKDKKYESSEFFIKDIIEINTLNEMIYNDILLITKDLYKIILNSDDDLEDFSLDDILNALSIKIKSTIDEPTYINYIRYALRKKYEYMPLSDIEAYIAKLPNIYTT